MIFKKQIFILAIISLIMPLEAMQGPSKTPSVTTVSSPTVAVKQTPAATIEWTFSPPHFNPLHISLFNYTGWQNIGELDTVLSSVQNQVQQLKITALLSDLDILLPVEKYKSYVLKTECGTIPSNGMQVLQELLVTTPPTAESPWYLVLKVRQDTNLINFRERLLSAIPVADIQRKYDKIPRVVDLFNQQREWQPHITLGRIMSVSDPEAFKEALIRGAIIAGLNIRAKGCFYEPSDAEHIDMSGSNVTLKTRTSGKRGKLLAVFFKEESEPLLYRVLRDLEDLMAWHRVPSFKADPAAAVRDVGLWSFDYGAKVVQLPFADRTVPFELSQRETITGKRFAQIIEEHFDESPFYLIAALPAARGGFDFYDANQLRNKVGRIPENAHFFVLSKYRLAKNESPIKKEVRSPRFASYFDATMHSDAAVRAQNQLDYGLWTDNDRTSEVFLRWYLRWYLLRKHALSVMQDIRLLVGPEEAHPVLSKSAIVAEISKDPKAKQALDKWRLVYQRLYPS